MGADEEDKVSIIKAGIESEKYDPSIENTDLKVKYGINDKDFVLFFMGWLYNFSGLQEVIKELAKVKDKYSNLKLMIVGDGDAYDELKKLVGEYELFDRVILTGKQSFEEIPKFISISTVCILPAHLNDTMRNIVPIKMYEYMAMKNPVLVTKLPGVMKEFGENNGVIYVDKPEDVIETALKLDLNEEGNKARNFVEGNDWEKITDEFENFLGGLIEKTSQNLRFEDYLIIDPIHEFKGKNIDLDNLPRVSFCIPTFNSSRTLERCLKSIVEQKYHDIEIIIVDNGSGDNTVEIAKKYTDKIYFDDGLLGSVRQTSLEKATGNVIALFDSDIIIPHKNWLFNSVIYFNYSDSVSTVWPENIAPPNSPWTTRLYFNLWKMSMNDRAKKGKSVFGGGNALFLRNCLDEIGGINRNIHWGEDFEWAQNLRSHGYQVIATKDPLYHDTMHSMKEFGRKQFVASETFVKENINLMGLSKKDLIYENVMLGTKNMLYGIFLKKDFSWLLFPIFMFLRGLGFGFNYLKNTFEVKK
ncbi:MAG: glycosyltransferase [Methanobacterium paludis]|nr:glycosyltransferase [Methanobacterium paludis]